jgi:hypothetical protein
MIFKKCTSLILVFVLLVSNAGFAFNVHFCGNKIASVSLKPNFSSLKSEKDCCGVAIQKSSCCKNKTVHLQKKSENVVIKVFSFQTAIFMPPAIWQSIVFSPIANFKSDTATSYYCDAHAPPLFKLYSQYIFYDQF